MDFPIQVPFKLGRVKNSDEWTEGEELRYTDLINLINRTLYNSSSYTTVNPLTSSISLTMENNISHAESFLGEVKAPLEVNVPEGLEKRNFYLIVDSNMSSIKVETDGLRESTLNESFNRSVYVLRKIDESVIILYKIIKDVYVPDVGDFDSEDFLDWDILAG
jgi:hypothetical protein